MISSSILPESALWAVSKTENSHGNFLPLGDSYTDYERSLSRNFRSNLKKATNKLAKLSDVEFEIIGAEADLEKCLRRFCNIERSGWKGRSGTAIGDSDLLVDFYTSVLQGLQNNGVLEWHFLKYSDVDLAAHMAFRSKGKLVLWKLAYNESFSASSPGNQLMREIIRREIDNKESSEIDLTSELDWAGKWKLARRPYFQVLIQRRQNYLSTPYLIFQNLRNSARKNHSIRKIRRALRNTSKAK